jgi:hypothetical protein
MPYIANADIAAFLNVTLTTEEESQLAAIIPALEAYAESYCNRRWNRGSADVIETFDGGTSAFFPRHVPIDSITSVTNDGDAVDAEDIYNYGTHIQLAYTPARLPRSIVVTYRANVPLPADLKHALIQWAAQLLKSAPEAGKAIKSFTVGPVSVEYLTAAGAPTFVETVLNRYRLQPV